MVQILYMESTNRKFFASLLCFCTALFVLLLPFVSSAQESLSPTEPITSVDTGAVLYRPVEKNTQDLSESTRTVRVLVHYGRTEFFVANGKPYGIEYEAFAEYEKFLNKIRRPHLPRIALTFIPVHLEQLIPYLQEGKGDIAAGLLTMTEERKSKAAFTAPYIERVNEVLVCHKGTPVPDSLEGLSGKTVHVLRASSFVNHLNALNQRLAALGLPPVTVVEMPAGANDDDILEMVNAGILSYTFVDDFMAHLWARVLQDITVADSVVLHKGGSIGWAVRPDNPEFLRSLNGFLEYGKHHLKGKIRNTWKRYFEDTKLIKNPLRQEAFGRVKALGPHFRDAGTANKLDWLLAMAQGYQESELDQKARSPRGAVGVMQLLPDTAKGLGYRDITSARNNISAGVAYLNFIRHNYFNEPAIPPDARVDFALAAYNAGPARIQSLRQEAKRRGLNPNLWFNNVERVALDKIGEEPVRYVANINKYYIAYRMSHHLDEHKEKALANLPAGPRPASE